ncbi:dTDP-glucose 4,6-dehydratase [candidate division WWE3 bacterium CG08_land_8_20_14_0_20_40_13]|uniref:dTDP-glucose 4,6-dehydratase n=1 Tax=candidate division WWE3 bacterium CG08_land_8_20_14_0_20_40_13 TaxID=1975084 RepID=A0A2H0XDV0_UNCKA|nr:MAG: dTDP-glucose 4,6-dehydratase [candidate division WWE3 bacterium CG08_land_8_20_14_0_20_40_13]
MNLLVTGGCGFIGSNFIYLWCKNHPEDRIVNLDKLTYCGNLENLKSVEDNPNYKFVKGDICDRNLVSKLMVGIDIVVHFAAESHVDRSIEDSTPFVTTNVLGTQVLLDTALKNKVKRFHHISTDEVFGSLYLDSTDKFNEKTSYDPSSPYSASKAASDFMVRSYFRTHGLPVTISNCSNNFGPYQYPEKLIPLVITNLLEGKKVPVYGDGKNVRDWLYVMDHCRAIDLILSKGKIGETYCIGGQKEKEYSNIEVVRLILKLFGKDDTSIEFVMDRKGHDRKYAVNWSKINTDLGWAPKHLFEEHLEKTVNWYRKNENWWKRLKR